jgi:hypothetical protein
MYRLLWTVERIEHGRRLRQPGEQCRLRQQEVLRSLREVRLRCSLDPVRAVAVEDLVDVRVQDPALRPFARELDRETGLRRFTAERLGRLLDVEIARKLLRDRRAALDDMSGIHVREQRAHDAGVVERAVLPEAAILDRDGRPGHPLAHVLQVDRLTVLLGGDRSQERPVRRVDEGVRPDVDRSEVAQLAARHPNGGAGEPADHEHQQHDERSPCDEMSEPLPMLASALAALAPDCGQNGVWLTTTAARRRGHA